MENGLLKRINFLLLLSRQQKDLLSNLSQNGLILNFDELIKIINIVDSLQDVNIFKFLYSYKNQVHKILYEEEQSINIEKLKIKNEFAEYYYLCLLIKDNPEIVNYEYGFEFINNLYLLAKEIFQRDDKKFKKIVMAKILDEIINNFCESENK